MAVPVQKFRELVFQLLYSEDMAQPDASEMNDLMMVELSVPKEAVKEAQNRVRDIITHRKTLDAHIIAVLKDYSFERIPGVERNVLRLAVFEMLYDSSIPEKVAIAEALRLARKFGTDESVSFVNAILDNIYKHERSSHSNLPETGPAE